MNKEMELLRWLEDVSSQIKGAEEEALASLEQGDTEKYNQGMRRKAEILAGLSTAAIASLDGVNPKIASHVHSELKRFSMNASRALELNSVFYMAALLYPDDHRPGEPNNFELFAAEVAQSVS